jgi:hypothetical protein
MSDSSPPPIPEMPRAIPPPPARRDGCMTAFMVVGGLALLFPGLCFFAFASNSGVLGLIGFVLTGTALFLFVRAATPPRQ